MSRYDFGPRGPPRYLGPYDNRTSRKRNPSYKWKKSQTNVSRSTQKSGKYDHVVIEKEILKSSQLNTKENKLDDINKNNPSMVIKKGVYYHHDRKSKNINNNNNNNNNNDNRKDKENININRNVTLVTNTDELKKLKMMRLSNYNQNERKIYSNEFERNLIQSRQPRKRKQVIPPPYPPNYPINTKNNANLYQQPYIDSPSLQGRRRQQRIQSRQQTQQQYYRDNYNTQLPTTPAHALMQLRYEAENAPSTAQVYEKEYQSQNKYGAYSADGSWYPFPETQSRLNNERKNKKKSKKKDDEKKVDNTRKSTTNVSTEKYIDNITTDYTEVGLTPGQKINRIQNQLEYYFSDGNLSNDIHLRSLLNKEGWVLAKNIENFPRMSKYGAKTEMIIEAAYHSNFIEVKDNKYIRMKLGWEQFVSKNNKINIDKDKIKNKVIDIDLKKIPDNINDNDNNAVSKKEIKNIVKSIQLKDKKHKERQKKKKDKKSTKKDDSKKDKDNDNDNNNKKDNSNKNDNNINRKDDDGLQTALQELNSDNKKSKDKSTKSDDDQSAIDVD